MKEKIEEIIKSLSEIKDKYHAEKVQINMIEGIVPMFEKGQYRKLCNIIDDIAPILFQLKKILSSPSEEEEGTKSESKLDLKSISKKVDEILAAETPESIKAWLDDYRNKFEKCDCTHTQACKVCAESKDIDWSFVEKFDNILNKINAPIEDEPIKQSVTKVEDGEEISTLISQVYKLINFTDVEEPYRENLRQARKLLNKIQSKFSSAVEQEAVKFAPISIPSDEDIWIVFIEAYKKYRSKQLEESAAKNEKEVIEIIKKLFKQSNPI